LQPGETERKDEFRVENRVGVEWYFYEEKKSIENDGPRPHNCAYHSAQPNYSSKGKEEGKLTHSLFRHEKPFHRLCSLVAAIVLSS